MKIIRITVTACLCLAALGLGGCDKGQSDAAPGAAQPASASEPDPAKLNTYVKGYNTLVDDVGGFTEKYQEYKDGNYGSDKPRVGFVNNGYLPQGIAALQRARAMQGGSADTDAAADALIAAMSKVNTHLLDLQVYYESKAYLEDHFARGKKEDAAMMDEFKTAGAALGQFGNLLDRDIQRRYEAYLEQIKKQGDMLAYDMKLALNQSKGLLKMFDQAASDKDQNIFDKTDVQVALIEKTLADLRNEIAKAEQGGGKAAPSSVRSVTAQAVNIDLTRMMGDYRSLKIAQAAYKNYRYKAMVDSYNMAVDAGNSP